MATLNKKGILTKSSDPDAWFVRELFNNLKETTRKLQNGRFVPTRKDQFHNHKWLIIDELQFLIFGYRKDWFNV